MILGKPGGFHCTQQWPAIFEVKLGKWRRSGKTLEQQAQKVCKLNAGLLQGFCGQTALGQVFIYGQI